MQRPLELSLPLEVQTLVDTLGALPGAGVFELEAGLGNINEAFASLPTSRNTATGARIRVL